MILGPLAHFLHLCLHLLFHLCLTSSTFFHWNISPTLLECRFSAFFFLFVSSVPSLLVKYQNFFLLEAFRLHCSEPRPWQGSINIPFLEMPHIQKQKASSFCYICSHPLQYGEVCWVIQTRSGWSRLHPSSRLCLHGTGSSKSISKHTEAVPVGGMVSWSSYRSCVWRTWLELLSLEPSYCCAVGMRAWARHFISPFPLVQCTVVLLSPPLCHLPHGKTCHV